EPCPAATRLAGNSVGPRRLRPGAVTATWQIDPGPSRLAGMRVRTILVGATLIATFVLGVGQALADTAATVKILGPADVIESGLFGNLIEPQFEQAFPQYEL